VHQRPHLRIASARAGNVIGGGDWAANRIVPDAVRALRHGAPIGVRAPGSTRPWQHVLESLGGYLLLAERLHASPHAPSSPTESLAAAFNFGPDRAANRPVRALVEEILRHWPGRWEDHSDPAAPHEAGRLDLSTDRAFHRLGWTPRWDFEQTIAETISWYRRLHEGEAARPLCLEQIRRYLGIAGS
jgi:CDP-glucose 4,6-dehydratase